MIFCILVFGFWEDEMNNQEEFLSKIKNKKEVIRL